MGLFSRNEGSVTVSEAQVLDVLRTVQDHCEGDENHPSLLWLDHLAARTDDPDALIDIAREFPDQTIGLRARVPDYHRPLCKFGTATSAELLRCAAPRRRAQAGEG